MSNQYNESIKENLLDEVSSMSVDNFMILLDDLKIEDCNYNHYALQLSLYRYILETYYGVNINRQIIAHLKEDGVQTYSTPYMKNEVKSMLVNT